MAMPIMSFVVVIKGPVAKAGSMFILLRIIGIVDPTVAAKHTTISNEIPEIRALLKLLVKYNDISVSIIEHIKPFNKPTLNSFQRRISISVVCIAPVASPRTTIVDDWIPILPPRAATSGIK